MIIYLIMKGFDMLAFSIMSAIPTFETPVWLITGLPDIMFRLVSFNWYLPVFETMNVVIFLIGFTLAWKLIKVLFGIVQIDLNA